MPNADTSVHGIALGDGDSARRALGENRRVVPNDPSPDFPWHALSSRDGRQTLRLRHHAGDVA
jgi:hypothetical protein